VKGERRELGNTPVGYCRQVVEIEWEEMEETNGSKALGSGRYCRQDKPGLRGEAPYTRRL